LLADAYHCNPVCITAVSSTWAITDTHALIVPVYYPDLQEQPLHKKITSKLERWHILFILISPMWFCPTPHPAMRYKSLNLPSVLDMSHFKPGWEWSGGESGQRIHGLSRGYYLSGHGSLHIFHGCSQGAFSQLLAHCIHLKHLWVTCGLHNALSSNKKQMK